MSEPGCAQAGLRGPRPRMAWIDRRQFAAWGEVAAAEEDFQNRRTSAGIPKTRQYRMNVAKTISAPEGR